MIGFQNDRKGPSTMINEVNTMTTRQNDLVVKNPITSNESKLDIIVRNWHVNIRIIDLSSK